MKRISTLLAIMMVLTLTAFAKAPKNQYVRIKTSYGQCIIRLYNQTPKHRDNFIKLTKDGTLNGSLFHRVIQGFMIQGGDPSSKNAKPGEALGEGGLKYTVPAEFNDSLFHKKGVLAAARDNNPEKASSSTQFYLVQGKRLTDEDLDKLEQGRLQGVKIPEWKRAWYRTTGGVPHLDNNYTVYGEIVSGLDMVDRIAGVKTAERDRPVDDVPMTVELLSKSECKQMDKLLGM